jgi:hypothetical protein
VTGEVGKASVGLPSGGCVSPTAGRNGGLVGTGSVWSAVEVNAVMIRRRFLFFGPCQPLP